LELYVAVDLRSSGASGLCNIVGTWKVDADCALLCTLDTLVAVGGWLAADLQLAACLARTAQLGWLLYLVAVGIGGRRARRSKGLVDVAGWRGKREAVVKRVVHVVDGESGAYV
jgi:hypothetical protein